MKKNYISLLLIFSLLFLTCCSPDKQLQSCELEVKKFILDGNRLKIITEGSENCTGITVKFDHGNDWIAFFVNFTPKILKNAPPFGFSKKASFNKGYASLGVDKHIRKITDSPIILNEDTKINESNGKIEVSWSFLVKDTQDLSKIAILNDSKKIITISRLNKNDCSFIYNNLISEPKYVEQLPVSLELFPFKKFLSFCSKKWRINGPDKLIQEIFGVTDDDIKKLKKSGELELVNFLKILKKSDLKREKHFKTSGKLCKILITPFDARVHKKLSHFGFVFYAEKINKESFEQEFEVPVIELPKGSYIIRAIGNRYHGTSKLVNCYGGDKITLAIPVMPNI